MSSLSASAAEELAARLLGDLPTRLGGPHISHARRVASMVAESGDDCVIAAAYLHDVVEKGCLTAEELLRTTGDIQLVDLVLLLTRDDRESEADYLRRCASHPVACFIKRMDLADKLMCEDATVPAAVVEGLRQEARERLELLQSLARSASERGRPQLSPSSGWCSTTRSRETL